MRSLFNSFAAFWPYYLGEHSKKATRAFHFLGTSMMLMLIIIAIVFHSAIYLGYGVVCAYGLPWMSHFFIEKNRPATLRHPWFSLIGDFKMYALIASGRMTDELLRLEIHTA
jgi:hypothetical protein